MTTIKTFAQKFSNDWSMNMVSLLTCNLLTAVFPLLLAILTAALYVFGSLSPQAFHEVIAKMSSALPSTVSAAINMNDLQSNLVKITGPLTIISLAGVEERYRTRYRMLASSWIRASYGERAASGALKRSE